MAKETKKTFTEWLKYLDNQQFIQQVFEAIAKAC